MPGRLELRVLGPLEAVRDGVVIDLGGAKQRTVLAVLLVECGRVLSGERLADLVWAGAPPPAAATTLRAYISNLRKALRPDDVLVRRGQGYVLDAPDASFDAARFEAAAREGLEALTAGEHAHARALLSGTLGLWRGRPYEDFAYEPFAQSEVRRLEELRASCVEGLARCRLALGEHEALAGELAALCVQFPMRENLWASRMTALYRSGRQGDALKVYEEARATLADELGIDPSLELRALHESILRQDPALMGAETTRGTRPAPGEHADARGPSGRQTLSFVFTDVELSTEMLIESVDQETYARAIEEHRSALRTAFATHGAQRIRTLGDAFFSAFDTASAAVGAALAAQVALQGQSDPGVRVRMGVHSGEVTVVDDDYVGLALHVAARIQAAAHGGQVLISQSSKDLLEADPADRVAFVDLGAHRLKDIPHPVRLYQLTHPELPAAFPPPRTLSAMPHNLPSQTTSFVGREHDVRRVADALGRARVVTLTGVGGVGKTRLAQEVGTELVPRYPDGVWLCELASAGDSDAILHAMARVLRLAQQERLTYRESVIASLRQRRILLILDNCEHLLEPVADLVEEILHACPHVRVLATSREAIGVDGEHIVVVKSLALPPEGLEDEHRGDAPAVTLFVDRARAVRQDFALGPHNVRGVTDICRRLDGIPLAIELAAARLTSMGPLEIAARLDRRFRFLRSGRRTAVERHRTLQATIDWSYALLIPDEQLLFERLSVFAGGCTLDAIEIVCAANLAGDVVDLLEGLVAKSLVSAETSEHETRYSMLETLRQYAADRLTQRGEADAIRDAHLEWFLGLSLESAEGLQTEEELRWVRTLDRETDNASAAHNWAVITQNTDAALRMIIALNRGAGAWRLRSSAMFDAWTRPALALPGAETHELAPRVYGVAGIGVWHAGNREEARRLAARALELAPEADDPRRAQAFGVLSVVAMAEGRGDDALAATMEAIRLARLGDDRAFEAQWWLNRSFFAGYFGDDAARLASLEEARRLAIAAPSYRIFERYATGEAILDADPAAALQALDEAAALARETGTEFFRNVAGLSAISLRGRHFDVHEALAGYPEIIESWYRTGYWRLQWTTLRNLLEHFARIGRDETAVILYFAAHASRTADPETGDHGERLRQLVPRLEERMGPQAFAEARRRGEAMGDDEAVAFALAEIRAATASAGGRVSAT